MFADIRIILLLAVVWVHGCEDPPTDCFRDQISFYLYQRQNEQPYELVLNEADTIKRAPFNPKANFKFIIHGYTGNKDGPLMNRFRTEYFKQKSWNLIFVDYSPLAQNGCYVESTFPSVPIVGKCCARLINLVLEEKSEINIEQFHVIGFSMGAQISAELSTNLEPKILPRITGLDPAWPLFYPIISGQEERLNRRYANFVDVIHTNAGFLGVLFSNGHYDVYANDGTLQPGCQLLDASCCHTRSVEYYIESINSKVPFVARKCSFWLWTTTRTCDTNSSSTIVVGEHATPPESSDDEGIYRFSTNKVSPYAMGPPAQ